MAFRWYLAVVLTTAALVAACAGKTASAPISQLDFSQCVDVTGASADLLTANDKGVARRAADILETYHPSADVKDAIEHFVSEGVGHSGADSSKHKNVLDDWVKRICPT
jgi:hypothetical protein